MFSRMWITKSTARSSNEQMTSDNISRFCDRLDKADAVVFGAGAVRFDGVTYAGKRFRQMMERPKNMRMPALRQAADYESALQ